MVSKHSVGEVMWDSKAFSRIWPIITLMNILACALQQLEYKAHVHVFKSQGYFQYFLLFRVAVLLM